MNYIQPVKRPINKTTKISWQNKQQSNRIMYEKFIEQMSGRELSIDEINELWKMNFGYVPDKEPENLYFCNVICNNLKIITTVIKRENYNDNERKYQVVRLNALLIDDYNNKRMLNIYNGKLEKGVENEDISLLAQKEKSIATGKPIRELNYCDGNWFTNLTIDDILGRLKIRINTECDMKFNSFNSMESNNFEIEDNDFKEELYDLINKKFIEIESQLE